MPDALFDVAPAPEPPAKVTTGERMRRRQASAIRRGYHPLTAALGPLKLHPDASRDADNRVGPGPRCGGCEWRGPHNGGTAQTFTKCWWRPRETGPYPRITGGPGTDVRSWWPACLTYKPKGA